ncbi:hypothetical protein GCM10008983_26840 [Lentibacillus halophilus]|uniref:DUF5105 domain-containing protein n=1 Tax=Lentibacillus halophilus TaxID=295065 RepID=A0ABP3JAS5_9BACI
MRFRSLAIMVYLSVFMLAACTDTGEKKGDAAIAQADLTDFEEQLMDLSNETSFAYDINLHNEKARQLEVMVEHYEDGEKVNEVVHFASDLKGTKPSDDLRVVFLRQMIGQGKEKWVASIMTENGRASTENIVKTPSDDYTSVSSGGVGSKIPFNIGEQKYAATIKHTNKTSVTQRTNMETEEAIKKATDYEHVYLMSVQLNEQFEKLEEKNDK